MHAFNQIHLLLHCIALHCVVLCCAGEEEIIRSRHTHAHTTDKHTTLSSLHPVAASVSVPSLLSLPSFVSSNVLSNALNIKHQVHPSSYVILSIIHLHFQSYFEPFFFLIKKSYFGQFASIKIEDNGVK